MSQWVEHEVEMALSKEIKNTANVLFPVRLDNAILQSNIGWALHIRRTRHIGNFTDWKDYDSYQQAFERLLRDLKAASPKADL
jgi:hypothetical protein